VKGRCRDHGDVETGSPIVYWARRSFGLRVQPQPDQAAD
jgi:hypothetical protein